MSDRENGERFLSRARRIRDLSRLLGVQDADRYCFQKGDAVRLIRGADSGDPVIEDRFVSALDREFPGPDETPVPVVFLAMVMRETGDASPGRPARIIQDAVRRGIDELQVIKTPPIQKH